MDVVYNAYQYYFTKRKYEFQNNNYEAEKNFKTDYRINQLNKLAQIENIPPYLEVTILERDDI